jgi:hypothetical protein
MADIIEFGKKATDLKSERDTSLRQRKVETLRKIFQCTRCVLKCSKCGAQLEGKSDDGARFAAPYALCKSCLEEYQEYRERVSGKTGPSCYWHNSNWMKVWESWLAHQKFLDEYRQSKEFLQLLEEVEDLLRK